ncbi:MAG: hypothetical protein IK118_00175 [Clostridia bacterium]|nr:hypothetical protein [Clostridia bacterium]MBR5426735.1 hypothetical protein [Clostridia bacterium]
MDNDFYTGAPAPEATEQIVTTEVILNEKKDKKAREPRFRGKVNAIDPRMLFVLFGIFTVIMAAIRAFQLMYLFEPDTGFFFIEKENSIAIPLLYTVAAVSFAIYFILSHLSAKIPEGVPPQGKNYYLAVSAVIYAVSLVATAMIHFSEIFDLYDSREWDSMGVFFKETQSLPRVLEIAFAMLAALYMIVIAVSYFLDKKAYDGVKVMSVFPIGFYIFRLMGRFIRAQSFLSVTELFWEIVAAVLMMLFFLEFARIMAGAEGKDKLHFAFGLGLAGASASLMIFISRLAAYIFAGSAYLTDDSAVEFCDFGAALLVIVFLLSSVFDLKAKEHPTKDLVIDQPTATPVVPEAKPVPSPDPRSDEDEAFRIADEYSNRYISGDGSDV